MVITYGYTTSDWRRSKMSKKKKHVDIMIDIETLGKVPGSVILSVGAVVFDIETGDPVDENSCFYDVISLESSLHAGLKVDSSTLLWWMSEDQSEARNALLEELNDENASMIEEVLIDLGLFIEKWTGDNKKKVWANPPTFDLMILESAYDILYMEVPWKHYEMMDLRTLKKLYTGPKPKFEIEGHKHNALYDAKLQAKICSHVLKWFREGIIALRKHIRSSQTSTEQRQPEVGGEDQCESDADGFPVSGRVWGPIPPDAIEVEVKPPADPLCKRPGAPITQDCANCVHTLFCRDYPTDPHQVNNPVTGNKYDIEEKTKKSGEPIKGLWAKK